MRPSRILVCLSAFALINLAGCVPDAPFERVMPRILDVAVPEQHERFSREYAQHLLAGDFETAQSMVPTQRFCTTDMRNVEFDWQEPIREKLTCTNGSDAMATLLHAIPRGQPGSIRVVNYNAHRQPGELMVNIEQEFVYDDLVVRVAMDYERRGDDRRVTEAVLTLDDETLFARIDEAFAAMPFNIFGWLIGLQLALYLSVPLIVFWIVRRQRQQQAGGKDGEFIA